MKQETGNWNPIVSFTSYSEIKETQAYRLKVVAQNSNFKLYVNDELVAERNDNSLQGGKVGIVIPIAAGEKVEFEIDSFRLSPIQSNSE
ncbi:MAG: hypothetical protein DHS20C20_01620 [Ardenticatenaceae bacterium]|nr:MAG: hypothetical protein DHS20C20_01620 [Ardenticatenaceae bacterium]